LVKRTDSKAYPRAWPPDAERTLSGT
jgi:hypothetical protein